MERSKLAQLLVEHGDQFRSTDSVLTKRHQQSFVETCLMQKEVIVINGVRRSGKSTLMKLIYRDLLLKYQVLPQNILYLNFEDERFIDFDHRDFETLYESFLEISHPQGRQYFFLDEVQNISGWERWVNRLYEFGDVKVIVTGSNTTLLSSDISTALTGRNRQVTLFPFSFEEFLDFRGYALDARKLHSRDEKVELKNLCKDYLVLGGFPAVLINKDTTLLEQYFKDIVYRDVIARLGIRHTRQVRELVLFLASNIGTIQSYQKLRDLIGVRSINTVKNYLDILESVHLASRLKLFDYSIKRQIYNPSKIYFIDVALSRSVAFKVSENRGLIHENIVFLELLRRGHEIYYWKSRDGKEVDFLVRKNLEIEKLIQVSISLENKTTREREMNGLRNAHDEFGVKDMLIITEDEEGEERIGNARVRIVPLWKWLIKYKGVH